jgi:hypothetical protein
MIEHEEPNRPFSAREIETAFVADHWQYGSLVHQRAAEWLVGALAAEREPAERHVLFSRLFGEFAGTLETYAAWAWSLRNRFEMGSFLDAYLGYSNRDVGEFSSARTFREISSYGPTSIRSRIQRYGKSNACAGSGFIAYTVGGAARAWSSGVASRRAAA